MDEVDGRPRVLAFIMPQAPGASKGLSDFLTTIDRIEQETGLDFLCELPDDVEDRLEAHKEAKLW